MGIQKLTLIEQLAMSQARRLRQFLRRRVKNAGDIPDIAQEVFLRLLRVPHHDTIRAPEAYMFTIAQHVAQQYSMQHERSARQVDVDSMLTDLCADTSSDPTLKGRMAISRRGRR